MQRPLSSPHHNAAVHTLLISAGRPQGGPLHVAAAAVVVVVEVAATAVGRPWVGLGAHSAADVGAVAAG